MFFSSFSIWTALDPQKPGDTSLQSCDSHVLHAKLLLCVCVRTHGTQKSGQCEVPNLFLHVFPCQIYVLVVDTRISVNALHMEE